MPLRDVLGLSATDLHLVWGRVVPDILDFWRELVAVVAIGVEAIVYCLGP